MTERLRMLSESCPNCGAGLTASDDTTSMTCDYCDSRIIIDWEGKIGGANYVALAKAEFTFRSYLEGLNHIKKALETNPNSGEAWLWRAVFEAPEQYSEVYRTNHAPLDLYLERSELADEDIVTSFVTVGKSARKRFYTLSLGLITGITNELSFWRAAPERMIIDMRIDPNEYQRYLSSLTRLAACSLEAVRRLDPKLAIQEAKNHVQLTENYINGGELTPTTLPHGSYNFYHLSIAYILNPAERDKIEHVAQGYMEFLNSVTIKEFKRHVPNPPSPHYVDDHISAITKQHSTMINNDFYETIKIFSYPPSYALGILREESDGKIEV